MQDSDSSRFPPDNVFGAHLWITRFLTQAGLTDRVKAITINEVSVSTPEILTYGGPESVAKDSKTHTSPGVVIHLIYQTWITFDAPDAFRVAWEHLGRPAVAPLFFDGRCTRILSHITPHLSGFAAEVREGDDISWALGGADLSYLKVASVPAMDPDASSDSLPEA